MVQNRKMATGGLVLAGLAAYAYYKYSKMTPEKRQTLMSDLKEKGKKLYDQYMPEQMKNMVNEQMNTGGQSQANQSTQSGPASY